MANWFFAWRRWSRWRRVLLSLGVALLVGGAFYLVEGIPGTESSGSSQIASGDSLLVGVQYPYALTNSVHIEVHWASIERIVVLVRSCGPDPTCAGVSQVVIAQGTGVNGSLSFTGYRGIYYAVTPTDSAHFWYTGTTLFPYFDLALPVMLGGLFLTLLALFRPLGNDDEAGDSPTSPKVLLEALLALAREKDRVLAFPCPKCNKLTRVGRSTTAEDLARCARCGERLETSEVVELVSAGLETSSKSSLSDEGEPQGEGD